VIALAWLFNSSCNLFTRSCWPHRQISEPHSATEVTAATITLRIRSIDRPPLLLLRLATRCKAPLALAILFSKCALKLGFESSQKPSHFVASCLIANDCLPMRTTTLFAAWTTLLRLLNSNTSGLLTSNSTLLSEPHCVVSLAIRASRVAPSSSSSHSITRPMASTNEMDRRVECLSSNHWKMALTDRIKSTGDTGEPCGRPAWMARVSPVRPSITSMAYRFDRNESTQRTMLPAMPTCIMRSSRCVLSTLSNAPLTSSSSASAVSFAPYALSTFATSCATASEVPLLRRQPNCPLWKTSSLSQKEAIRVAIAFSTTFPRQLSRLMIRYAFAIV
jgi:hypothetical protein